MIEACEVSTCKDISLSSSTESFGGSDNWVGQLVGDCWSQAGPFHQRVCCRSSAGKRPLEAQSAGLWRSCAKREAPHNSRRGIVSRLMGETFVFAITNET